MKVVILAGGFGTRLMEETARIPKPMVEVGGKPILWHIMKIYAHYGYHDFIVCLGYKGHMVKEWFQNYFLHNSDVTIDLQNNKLEIHNTKTEPWKITLVDTGLNTNTGGRIKRVQKYLGNETFMLTYGDGISDIDIHDLVKAHRQAGKLATVTAVIPPGRFGSLALKDNLVEAFQEKVDGEDNYINGGFFVLEPKIFDYLCGDEEIWERAPLETLAKEGQLAAYFHKKFWKPMDKLVDQVQLEELWNSQKAPWKIWSD